jgi:hypothetical protein
MVLFLVRTVNPVDIIKGGGSLTELPALGPYLNRQIVHWLEHPPDLEEPNPEIRRNFLTLAGAKTMRSTEPERFAGIRWRSADAYGLE